MIMEKAAAPGKKRKLRLEEHSEDLPSSSVQLKTRRVADAPLVNFPSSTCESAALCLGSCCSSDLAKVQEEEVTVDQFLVTSNGAVTVDRRERRCEIQVESEPTNDSNPRRRGCFTGEKMPSDDDLEEFFSSAETNLQKQFIDKYNYDTVKDEPLEGRFEWVQIQKLES